MMLLSPFGGYLWAVLWRNRPKVAVAGIFIFLLLTSGHLIHALYTLNITESIPLWAWSELKALPLSFGVTLPLCSRILASVVLSVSFLVHVYSLGYMKNDPKKVDFMAYLSLFTGMMLVLVLAPNLFQLFLGWEGVGLASYLLIGFWSHKPKAEIAAIKAFVTNRVGDLGLILGCGLVYASLGTLDIQELFVKISTLDHTMLNLIAFFFFIGAMGKSAQFGLHVWLPDAMEGPTPVSALIHAATMVTAGVFLLVRLSPLYALTPKIQVVIISVGFLTAFFAGTVALAQNDIKRVIAYSTCSQLGFMMIACGIGAPQVALFHLTMHAFFKALLFLSAGSVIHALSGEQDLRYMGGLFHRIPQTSLTLILGSLGLIGCPFFSGYFSKEEILSASWVYHPALWMAMLLLIALTAAYTGRLLARVLRGECRAPERVQAYIHESPSVMTVPLWILSLLTIFGGMLRGFFSMKEYNIPNVVVYGPSLLVAGIFILSLLKRYSDTPSAFFAQGWNIDALYERVLLRPLSKISTWTAVVLDPKGIDRLGPQGAAFSALYLGRLSQKAHQGHTWIYWWGMLLGLFALWAFGLWWIV